VSGRDTLPQTPMFPPGGGMDVQRDFVPHPHWVRNVCGFMSVAEKQTLTLKFNTMNEEKTNVEIKDQSGNSIKPLLCVVLSSGHVLEFQLQQTVYLKTDKEQKPQLVTGMSLRPFNSVTYGITESSNETWHYGFEISDERDIVMATSN